MTAHLQAALAFALTMMALATIVTVIMEILSRFFRRRHWHLRHMLTLVYESHIAPRIERVAGRLQDDAARAESEVTREVIEKVAAKPLWTQRFALYKEHRNDPNLRAILNRLHRRWKDEAREQQPRLQADQGLKEFVEEKEETLSDDLGAIASRLEAKRFAERIARSPFQPNRYSWWSSALSKIANLLGAGAASEMSREDFVRRFARDDAGTSLREEAGVDADAVIQDIALRFDEVADGAREYFVNSSRIISILLGISLALLFNVEGIRIYKDFIDDPAKAARFVEQAEEYKEAFVEAQTKLDEALATLTDTTVSSDEGETEIGEVDDGNGEGGNEAGEGGTEGGEGSDSSDPLKEVEAAIEKAEAGLSDLTSQGVSIGWKFRPHCAWTKSGCEDSEAEFIGVFAWIFAAIITGILIGLGGPFWYDVVTGLTRATQIMRGRTPKDTTGAGAVAVPEKAARATEIFNTHVGLDEQTQLRKNVLRRQLKRLKDKIEAETGSSLPAYASAKTPPKTLKWVTENPPAKIRKRTEQRYEYYRDAHRRFHAL